ncbi:Uncharacterised protein [Actinomyces bovis]|uniref:Lipoprotein n=1 Tax=Actinomyces bovis TaxID=1658 RepID=A0ABY1VQ78_9ACTO|nr:hypothetical protein [Actinomyces bovis]SPT53902.1 Uncharacterised protein [Actinomyces bovis]VEG53350.1 Uncharacterised protein [Actinomyces israelii]
MQTQSRLRMTLSVLVSAALLATAGCGGSGGGAKASGSSTSASSQTSTATPSDAVGSTPTATESALSTPDLSNSTLDVPRLCADFALAGAGSQVAFTSSEALGPQPGSKVTMSPATSVTLANGPATMVLFSCGAGGNYIHDSLAIYDQDLKLLGSLEQWGGTAQRLPASFDSYRMEELQASGDTFTFAVSGIEVLGDDSSHAGAKTGRAQETVKWTGAGFAVTALSFSTPSGEVAAPDQAEVQAFFDAAASGDDTLVAKRTSGETLSHIQTGCVGLCERH